MARLLGKLTLWLGTLLVLLWGVLSIFAEGMAKMGRGAAPNGL